MAKPATKRSKSVTLADIGRAVGVDASTVSLVLNRKPLAERIKDETKQQIFAAAAALGYMPSPTARALRTGRSGMIGMVVGDIASGFYSEMAAAALRSAQSHQLQLLIAATEWDPAKEYNALATLMAQRVDGIIFLPASLTSHRVLYDRILAERLPLVTYDCPTAGIACVASDYLLGMREAVADLRRRHARVCYIYHAADVPVKREAFLTAAREQGLEVCQLRYAGSAASGHFGFDHQVLYRRSTPCACVVAGDEQAMILIDRLVRDGRRVPRDYEIVGIDGLRWSALFHPRFATIQQNCNDLMQAAFDLLTAPEFQPRTIRLPTVYRPAADT